MDGRNPGLRVVRRNGVHGYDNQDHAMMTATLTTGNMLVAGAESDVWRVSQAAAYAKPGNAGHESQPDSGRRAVPRQVP